MTGGIPDDKWRGIIGIIKKHSNITSVILYGSRAKGNFQNGSDIDLAVKGNGISSEQLTQIGLDYEDLYLPWKLSVTVYDNISNADPIDHINRVGIDILR
ncbi:MAG: nucleotidyltransferase domain-containing protein [Pseudomonadota bacterium]